MSELEKYDDEMLTSDLSRFGWREKFIAMRLLEAISKHGVPEDFVDDEVQVVFNVHSGCVFLTNSEYQTAMLNEGNVDRDGNATLETWYSCPECGHEGFKEDMLHCWDRRGCREYQRAIGVSPPANDVYARVDSDLELLDGEADYDPFADD